MTTLQIGDRKVQVGEEFLRMSPEDRQKTVDEIARSLGGTIEVSEADRRADVLANSTMPRPGYTDRVVGGFVPFADEAGALGTTVGRFMKTGDWDWSGVREEQKILEEAAREQQGTAGKIAEIGGAIAGGTLAKAPAAANRIGRILQAGREAGALGGMHAAGQAEGGLPERLTAGGIGAGASAALGAGLSGVVEGAGALRNALPKSTNESAAIRIRDALEADNLTPDQALGRLGRERARGNPATLMDVGEDATLGLARGTAIKPGAGRTQIANTLRKRDAGQRGRIQSKLDEILGSSDQYRQTRQQIRDVRSGAASKKYDEAFARNYDPSPEIESLLERVPPEAIRNAQRVAKAEGRPFGEHLIASIDDAADTVTFRRVPSLREMEYIRRGLRSAKDTAYRSGNSEVGTAYKGLEQAIKSELDSLSPDLRAVRAQYADSFALEEALDRGIDLVRTGPTNARQLDEMFQAIKDASPVEKEMMRMGASRQLQAMLDGQPDGGNAVRKIFGNATRREMLRQIFPDSKSFREFRVLMMSEARMAQSANAAIPERGSRTAFAEGERDVIGDIATTGLDAMQGGALNATFSFLRKFVNNRNVDPEVSAQVARLMTMNDPDAIRQALAIAARHTQPGVPATVAQTISRGLAAPTGGAVGQGF